MCKAFGKVPLGLSWEATPGINRHLVQGRFQIEANGDTMLYLKCQRILHQHTHNTAGQLGRRHGGAYTRQDLDAIDLITMDGSAKAESRSIDSTVDQPE